VSDDHEQPIQYTAEGLVDGDDLFGFCGFCNRPGHRAKDCTALTPSDQRYAAAIRAAAHEALHAHYEPTGLILHPFDDARVQIAAVPPGPDRAEVQRQIAAAFDVPLWMLGVEGERAPWRVRWHPRAVRNRLARRARAAFHRLPGVHYYPGHKGWMYDGPPSSGRWWIRVGPYLIGRGVDDWWDL
jgi:hypothetical protein